MMVTLSLLILLMYRAMKLIDKSDAKRVKRETPFMHGGAKDPSTTVVGLTLKDDVSKQVFCWGNILSKTFISTAANCMDKIKDETGNLNVENLEVVTGEANLLNYGRGEKGFEEIFSVKRAIVHPHYNGNIAWDIALLELKEEIDLQSEHGMEAAVLPPPELRLAGREITLGGWGQADGISGRQIFDLQVINMTVHPQDICEKKYPDFFIKENMFCASASDTTACPVDSGSGGLLHANGKIYLLGVVSYGLDSDCKDKIVFQNIVKSLPWIFKETGLTPDYKIYSTGTYYEEFIEDTSPPPPPPKKDLIYLGGGVMRELPTFSPLSNCTVPPYPIEVLKDAVTIVIEGEIMTCGGKDRNHTPHSACHILTDGTWQPQPSMKTKRCGAAASLTENEMVMVTGGFDANDYLSSTEIFTGEKWEYGDELPVKMIGHCQLTSNAGVIVAGFDFDNQESFLVYRLEKGQWNKITERNWKWRHGHSCELLDEDTMVVMGGDGPGPDENYFWNIDILDLGSLSWSKGLELPVGMNFDQSTVYQETLFIIETYEGLVYSIPTNLTGEWKKIGELGKLPSIQWSSNPDPAAFFFPAPVLMESDFKCE